MDAERWKNDRSRMKASHVFLNAALAATVPYRTQPDTHPTRTLTPTPSHDLRKIPSRSCYSRLRLHFLDEAQHASTHLGTRLFRAMAASHYILPPSLHSGPRSSSSTASTTDDLHSHVLSVESRELPAGRTTR